MRLTVGAESFELSSRALVIGVLDAGATPLDSLCHAAERLVADGADILHLAGEDMERVRAAVQALRTTVAVPLGVATTSAAVARAACLAGAVLTRSVEAAVDTGATLVSTGAGAAGDGARAGVSPDRIVLDITPCLRPRRDHLALGYPVLASAPSAATQCMSAPDDRLAGTWAAAALAVSTGCRLVRTADVRGVRRVRDVLAAVLAADSLTVEPRP